MAQTNNTAPTFEQALADIERIVHDLEEGKCTLEESLSRYEKGVALLKGCYGQLRVVEQRILELTGQDEQGNPLTRTFDHCASIDGAPDSSKEPKKRKVT